MKLSANERAPELIGKQANKRPNANCAGLTALGPKEGRTDKLDLYLMLLLISLFHSYFIFAHALALAIMLSCHLGLLLAIL